MGRGTLRHRQHGGSRDDRANRISENGLELLAGIGRRRDEAVGRRGRPDDGRPGCVTIRTGLPLNRGGRCSTGLCCEGCQGTLIHCEIRGLSDHHRSGVDRQFHCVCCCRTDPIVEVRPELKTILRRGGHEAQAGGCGPRDIRPTGPLIKAYLPLNGGRWRTAGDRQQIGGTTRVHADVHRLSRNDWRIHFDCAEIIQRPS